MSALPQQAMSGVAPSVDIWDIPLLVGRPSGPSNIQILRENFEGIPRSLRGLLGAGKTDEELQPTASSTDGGITMLDEESCADPAKLAVPYHQASESAMAQVFVARYFAWLDQRDKAVPHSTPTATAGSLAKACPPESMRRPTSWGRAWPCQGQASTHSRADVRSNRHQSRHPGPRATAQTSLSPREPWTRIQYRPQSPFWSHGRLERWLDGISLSSTMGNTLPALTTDAR